MIRESFLSCGLGGWRESWLCAWSGFEGIEQDVAGFAFGSAHGEIIIITTGDFHLLAALNRGTNIESDQRAVKIDVVAWTNTLDLAEILRSRERRR